MKKKNYCDCGNKKDKRSKKCANCYYKRTKKIYFCECGEELSDYRAEHCKKCSLTIYHPQLGKTKELSANYKHGKSYNNRCVDCDCLIMPDSIRCWDCYVKWSQIPENNPNFIHGECYKPYPLGWTTTFKEQIRFRDNYKCQNCGCHEVENCRKLDVHHIDYNKENLNSDNLIALCQRCHGKTNGKDRDYWIKYYQDKIVSKVVEIKKINCMEKIISFKKEKEL